MTLAEIDKVLPNGFHDAEIEQFRWNFREDFAVFEINFWVATEDSDREKYQRGSLELRGIVFLVIDPPNPSPHEHKPYRCGADTLQIDGIETTEEIMPGLSQLKTELPSNTGFFSLFVENWKTYIHIAATQ